MIRRAVDRRGGGLTAASRLWRPQKLKFIWRAIWFVTFIGGKCCVTGRRPVLSVTVTRTRLMVLIIAPTRLLTATVRLALLPPVLQSQKLRWIGLSVTAVTCFSVGGSVLVNLVVRRRPTVVLLNNFPILIVVLGQNLSFLSGKIVFSLLIILLKLFVLVLFRV